MFGKMYKNIYTIGILKEWDYDKNILSPNGVTYQSHKKVWWKCLTDVSHPSYNMIKQSKW